MRLSSMGRYQKQIEQLQKKKKENALNVYSRAEDMTSFKQIWEILTRWDGRCSRGRSLHLQVHRCVCRSPAESSTTLAAETLTPFFNLLGASLSPVTRSHRPHDAGASDQPVFSPRRRPSSTCWTTTRTVPWTLATSTCRWSAGHAAVIASYTRV